MPGTTQPITFLPESDPRTKGGRESHVFSGTDVSVVFTIPATSPAYLADSATLQSIQLQTITLSSATSIFPVRRVGEAAATTYTKGSRTFAGSMVFSIIGEDPLQKLFSIDAVRSAARTDGKWHIDQMPPLDCILVFANEMGGSGIQVVQNIQFTNWGQTISIDDMYLENTYSYIADHISPFISNKYMAAAGINSNESLLKIQDMLNELNENASSPDDAVSKVINQLSAETIQREGDFLNSLLSDIFARYHANHVFRQSTAGSAIDGTFVSPTPGQVSIVQEANSGPEIPPAALVTNFPYVPPPAFLNGLQ